MQRVSAHGMRNSILESDACELHAVLPPECFLEHAAQPMYYSALACTRKPMDEAAERFVLLVAPTAGQALVPPLTAFGVKLGLQ